MKYVEKGVSVIKKLKVIIYSNSDILWLRPLVICWPHTYWKDVDIFPRFSMPQKSLKMILLPGKSRDRVVESPWKFFYLFAFVKLNWFKVHTYIKAVLPLHIGEYLCLCNCVGLQVMLPLYFCSSCRNCCITVGHGLYQPWKIPLEKQAEFLEKSSILVGLK